MNRNLKGIMMGLGLFLGFYVMIQLLRVLWILGIVMLPFLIAAAVVYFVGYGAPNFGSFGRKVHKMAETKVRSLLDWLDFNAPSWTWPAINMGRTFLDWLGLQVAKVR